MDLSFGTNGALPHVKIRSAGVLQEHTDAGNEARHAGNAATFNSPCKSRKIRNIEGRSLCKYPFHGASKVLIPRTCASRLRCISPTYVFLIPSVFRSDVDGVANSDK